MVKRLEAYLRGIIQEHFSMVHHLATRLNPRFLFLSVAIFTNVIL